MKRLLISLAAAATMAAAMPAVANAQPWTSINQRQAQIDRRIDAGVRTGQLTRPEAFRLRQEFRRITFLERQYRRSRPGLTMNERRDLDRRLNALSARIRFDRHDWQRR